MKQVKWFDRDFAYKPRQNLLPSILERLAGTPGRLEEKLASMPAEVLTRRVDATWSIKENVGHLTDCEPLWQGRLEDILTGKTELRPTDLQNSKTFLANHNATLTDELIAGFRHARAQTVQLIAALDEKDVLKSALHPRLKSPMRALDLALFVVEHDDHHLARMSELGRLIYGGGQRYGDFW